MSAESEKAAKELSERINVDAAKLIAEKLAGPTPPPGRVEEITAGILKPTAAPAPQPKPKA
jgi:hypothetical protein